MGIQTLTRDTPSLRSGRRAPDTGGWIPGPALGLGLDIPVSTIGTRAAYWLDRKYTGG
jgi:hypothetical protein